MSRPFSKLAPDWWDYTTLEPGILADAARIDEKKLRIPERNLHFPTGDFTKYSKSYDDIRCVVMQGGQGEIKHWAFNDPLPRKGKYKDAPPSPGEYGKLGTRKVQLHPVTITQNARTSGGGNVVLVPTEAATVGPRETWKAEKVSIWLHRRSLRVRNSRHRQHLHMARSPRSYGHRSDGKGRQRYRH